MRDDEREDVINDVIFIALAALIAVELWVRWRRR